MISIDALHAFYHEAMEGKEQGGLYAIAYSLLKCTEAMEEIAGAIAQNKPDDSTVEAICSIANALHALGTANAASPMGAVEFLGVAVEKVADQISMVASAISERE